MGFWDDMKGRYESLIAEYGTIALATYLGLFVLTFLGFWAALQSGFEVSSAAGSASTAGGAYIATKLTQPLRIGATLVLTPAVAWIVRRVRPPTPDTPRSTATPSPE